MNRNSSFKNGVDALDTLCEALGIPDYEQVQRIVLMVDVADIPRVYIKGVVTANQLDSICESIRAEAVADVTVDEQANVMVTK